MATFDVMSRNDLHGYDETPDASAVDAGRCTVRVGASRVAIRTGGEQAAGQP